MLLVEFASTQVEEVMSPITLALLAGPTVGVIALIGVIIQGIIQRRNARDNTHVSQQEADTHEFDALRQGFVDQMKELRQTVSDVRKEREDQKQEFNMEREKLRAEFEKEREKLREDMDALLEHLTVVEELVPNPPGAPPRPRRIRR